METKITLENGIKSTVNYFKESIDSGSFLDLIDKKQILLKKKNLWKI